MKEALSQRKTGVGNMQKKCGANGISEQWKVSELNRKRGLESRSLAVKNGRRRDRVLAGR